MRISQSKVWIFLIVISILHGLLTVLSPYSGDDLRYHCMFVNVDIDPNHLIKSLKDVVDSNIVHFRYVNGRALIHLIIQSITGITGKLPFNILNPLFFAAYIALICQIGIRRITCRAMVWIIGLLLFLMPTFCIEYLWMCGAINYLWSSVFVLLFLLLLRNTEERQTKDYRWWKLTLLLLFAFIAGGLHEGITVPLCAGLMIRELLFWHKKRSYDWHLLRPWLILAFTIGALICTLSTIQRAHNQYESFMGSLQERWNCGVYIWSKLRLTYLLVVVFLIAMWRKIVGFKTFIKENIVYLIAIVCSMAIAFYTGLNYVRISYAAELFSLILIIQLAGKFRFSKTIKKWTTAIFAILIMAFYGVICYYSYLNYKESNNYIAQMRNGAQLVLFDKYIIPDRMSNHICHMFLNGDGVWHLDPDNTMCKVFATIYGLDYMLFMPETLYEMLNNYPDGFEEFTDCGGLPFYTKRIDKDMIVKEIIYNLREAKPEEIPFYCRPFSRFCDQYKKTKYTFNPTTLLYNDQLYLFVPKLDKDFDDRLTEITIVKEEDDLK
ncbi:MAG: hypothetical protein IJL29_10760 [Prevotella sp.]|nr:hypothetical protein [Prevotella sp.]MBQ6033478.1 hypothetical protein [Prevotella sp.]